MSDNKPARITGLSKALTTVKDWFGRQASESFTFYDASRRTMAWDKGHEDSLVSVLLGSRDPRQLKNTGRVLTTMFRVIGLDVKKTKFVYKPANNTQQVHIPIHLLRDEEGEYTTEAIKADAFVGLALQNAAHKALQTNEEYNLALRSTRTSGKYFDLGKYLFSLLNDERVHKLLSKKSIGYMRFVQKFKDDQYGELEPMPDDAEQHLRLLDLLTRLIRFPKRVTEQELLEFQKPLEQIGRLLQKFNGTLPDEQSEVLELSKKMAKIVTDFVPSPPPPPPMPPMPGPPQEDESSPGADGECPEPGQGTPPPAPPEEQENTPQNPWEKPQPSSGGAGEQEDDPFNEPDENPPPPPPPGSGGEEDDPEPANPDQDDSDDEQSPENDPGSGGKGQPDADPDGVDENDPGEGGDSGDQDEKSPDQGDDSQDGGSQNDPGDSEPDPNGEDESEKDPSGDSGGDSDQKDVTSGDESGSGSDSDSSSGAGSSGTPPPASPNQSGSGSGSSQEPDSDEAGDEPDEQESPGGDSDPGSDVDDDSEDGADGDAPDDAGDEPADSGDDSKSDPGTEDSTGDPGQDLDEPDGDDGDADDAGSPQHAGDSGDDELDSDEDDDREGDESDQDLESDEEDDGKDGEEEDEDSEEGDEDDESEDEQDGDQDGDTGQNASPKVSNKDANQAPEQAESKDPASREERKQQLQELAKQFADKLFDQSDDEDLDSDEQDALDQAMSDLTDSLDEKEKHSDFEFDLENTGVVNGDRDKVRWNIEEGDLDEYNRVKKTLNMTQARVLQKLFTQKHKEQQFVIKGMKSGRFDTNKLVEAVQGVPTVYERMGEVTTNKICVGILIDESGSMSGGGYSSYNEYRNALAGGMSDEEARERYVTYAAKIKRAQQASIFLNEVFGKLADVQFFVYGHTADQKVPHGFKSSTDMYVYREPGKRAASYGLSSVRARGCNRDGKAIKLAAMRIRKFTQDPGILLVISDGMPNAIDYDGQAAVEDTRKQVSDVERMGFQVIQVAIESGVPSEEMFTQFVNMLDIKTLPRDLIRYMSKRVGRMIRPKVKL